MPERGHQYKCPCKALHQQNSSMVWSCGCLDCLLVETRSESMPVCPEATRSAAARPCGTAASPPHASRHYQYPRWHTPHCGNIKTTREKNRNVEHEGCNRGADRVKVVDSALDVAWRQQRAFFMPAVCRRARVASFSTAMVAVTIHKPRYCPSLRQCFFTQVQGCYTWGWLSGLAARSLLAEQLAQGHQARGTRPGAPGQGHQARGTRPGAPGQGHQARRTPTPCHTSSGRAEGFRARRRALVVKLSSSGVRRRALRSAATPTGGRAQRGAHSGLHGATAVTFALEGGSHTAKYVILHWKGTIKFGLQPPPALVLGRCSGSDESMGTEPCTGGEPTRMSELPRNDTPADSSSRSACKLTCDAE